MRKAFEKWLEEQGHPHGMECVGAECLYRIWQAAHARCAGICKGNADDWKDFEAATIALKDCAEEIRRGE